jgi:hypothetical protein
VHFRSIYDGLLFRRLGSQVPGDPPKNSGGVCVLLAPAGPLTHFPASRRTLRPPSCVCGGHRQPRVTAKKRLGSKMGGAGVFPRILLDHGPAWWLLHSAFARNWTFRHATGPLFRRKASKINGEGPRWSWEWKSHKILALACSRNAAVEKGVPSKGP